VPASDRRGRHLGADLIIEQLVRLLIPGAAVNLRHLGMAVVVG
jgi:hypothetical protein